MNKMQVIPSLAALSGDPVSPADQKTVMEAFGLGLAAAGAVLVAWIGIRMALGYYIGGKMGVKWGWAWGGIGGIPGLALLGMYNKSKGRV